MQAALSLHRHSHIHTLECIHMDRKEAGQYPGKGADVTPSDISFPDCPALLQMSSC